MLAVFFYSIFRSDLEKLGNLPKIVSQGSDSFAHAHVCRQHLTIKLASTSLFTPPPRRSTQILVKYPYVLRKHPVLSCNVVLTALAAIRYHLTIKLQLYYSGISPVSTTQCVIYSACSVNCLIQKYYFASSYSCTFRSSV